MTINEAQDEVIEQFQDFSDWMDKYQLLIDLGGELEPLADKYKTEQNLIDHTPKEILDADLYFIDRIGLKDHLSPTRSNGLLAMVKQIKMYALAYESKH